MQACNLFYSGSSAQTASKVDDDLALKLGALILRCMGRQGGEVLRVIDESGLSFAQMKVLVELQTPDAEHTVTALAEQIGISAASASRAADGSSPESRTRTIAGCSGSR